MLDICRKTYCLSLSWLLAAAMLILTGCSFFGYISAGLTVSVTNDNNQVLSVEGHSNLPDGTVVRAVLKESEKPIAKNTCSLENGRFHTVLDISLAPGNCALSLEAVIDPVESPLDVKDVLGSHGEFLIGEQVEDIDGSSCLVNRMRLVLPMNKRNMAIRRVQAGDYNLGIAALEGIMAVEPNDDEVKAWLGYALLSRDSSENSIGSRAYELLNSVNLKKLNEPIRSLCGSKLARWKEAVDKEKQERERRQAIRSTLARREARKSEIKVGRTLGGVDIGVSARDVYQLAIPDKYPAWSSSGLVLYHMPDRPVDVYFDGQTSVVVEVYTESRSYLVGGRVGVGQDMADAEEMFPDGRLTLDSERFMPDGSRVSFGQFACPRGVVFKIKRMAANDGTLISDIITGISIVAPFSWEEAPAHEQPSEQQAAKASETQPALQKAYPQAASRNSGEDAVGNAAVSGGSNSVDNGAAAKTAVKSEAAGIK